MNSFTLAVLELTVTGAGRWLLIGLAMVLGGVLGSFINVVAYRVPQGLSLVHPGSRCPLCGHAIRWHDNLPVLGWLLLRGECRDCGARISGRYPLLELIAALIGGLVAWCQAMTALPGVVGWEDEYVVSLATFIYFMALCLTLLTAALIEFDGARPPLAMLLGSTLVGLIGGALWPSLRGSFVSESQSGLAMGAAGWGAGMLLSALAWPAWFRAPRGSNLARSLTNAAELCLVGSFLGVPSVCLVGVTFVLLPDRMALPRFRWGACAMLIALAMLLAPALNVKPGWELSELAMLCLAGALVALVALVRRLLGDWGTIWPAKNH